MSILKDTKQEIKVKK